MSDFEESKFTPFAIVPMDSPIKALLQNLQLSGQGETFDKGYVASGRVGTNIPLSEDSSIDLGVSGQSVKFDKFKEMKPTGIDAAYNWGNNTIAAQFNKMSPEDKSIFLQYIKQF